MIGINTLRKILDSKEPFDCKVWRKDAEILHYKNVICTSTNFKRNTANLLFIESRQMRKVRIVMFFEINDIEIYL